MKLTPVKIREHLVDHGTHVLWLYELNSVVFNYDGSPSILELSNILGDLGTSNAKRVPRKLTSIKNKEYDVEVLSIEAIEVKMLIEMIREASEALGNRISDSIKQFREGLRVY